LSRDGVVRTPAHHVQALSNVIKAAENYDWRCVGVVPSRLQGASGNREFFVLLRRAESAADLDLAAIIEA
jgi:23S rRNA (cytidine1920-2'-O)/16S rRNA (cytidine1409-2'-O)-methyltransferase